MKHGDFERERQQFSAPGVRLWFFGIRCRVSGTLDPPRRSARHRRREVAGSSATGWREDLRERNRLIMTGQNSPLGGLNHEDRWKSRKLKVESYHLLTDQDVRLMIVEARPIILEKAKQMGK